MNEKTIGAIVLAVAAVLLAKYENGFAALIAVVGCATLLGGC